MYIPAYFSVSEKEEIVRFIRQNAFGQLISQAEGRLFSSHIPFLVMDEGAQLLAHLAKPNPQWKDIKGQVCAHLEQSGSYDLAAAMNKQGGN